VAEAAAVDGYNAVPRSTGELIADLGSWSPAVQRRAANQLATRSINTATLDQLTALANDPNGSSRVGACLTLGKIATAPPPTPAPPPSRRCSPTRRTTSASWPPKACATCRRPRS
jgi:hypothetical protein